MPSARIVEAALEIIDATGVEGLTARSLATRIGASTATIYRHLENRTALLDEVVEQILDGIWPRSPVGDDTPWQAACRQICLEIFDAVARHPRAAGLVGRVVPTGPHAMRLREELLDVLLRAGLPESEVHRLAAMLARLTIGFASQLEHAQAPGAAAADAQVAKALQLADRQRYPTTSLVASRERTTFALRDEFTLALELCLAGMQASRDGARPGTMDPAPGA